MLTEHTILFEQEPNQTKPNQWNKQIPSNSDSNKTNQTKEHHKKHQTNVYGDAILNFWGINIYFLIFHHFFRISKRRNVKLDQLIDQILIKKNSKICWNEKFLRLQ